MQIGSQMLTRSKLLVDTYSLLAVLHSPRGLTILTKSTIEAEVVALEIYTSRLGPWGRRVCGRPGPPSSKSVPVLFA
jgi:hypothetical protein